MALESVTNIDDLNASNPTATDPVSEGDDHIRNIKTALLTNFPGISDAMTSTHTELNYLDGTVLGTVVASKAVGVDASKKVNEWLVDNLTLDGNDIASASGLITLTPTTDVSIVGGGLRIPTGEGVQDAGGSAYILFTEDTSPVNYWTMDNTDTSVAPSLGVAGTDTNINLNLVPKGSGKVDVQGGFMTSETTTGANAHAVAITGAIHEFSSTGADALTLADGAEGQHLFIVCTSNAGGDATLTPSNLAGGTTLTFSTTDESCHLMFTSGDWYFMGGNGVAIA